MISSEVPVGFCFGFDVSLPSHATITDCQQYYPLVNYLQTGRVSGRFAAINCAEFSSAQFSSDQVNSFRQLR
jgi:hypothetical protein